MWTARVIFRPPRADLLPGIEQVPEPACVQALIAQLAVEALHAAILRRLAGLDVHQIDLPVNGPGQVVPRSEFRALSLRIDCGLP